MKTDENQLACHNTQKINMTSLCCEGYGQQNSISGDELYLFVAR